MDVDADPVEEFQRRTRSIWSYAQIVYLLFVGAFDIVGVEGVGAVKRNGELLWTATSLLVDVLALWVKWVCGRHKPARLHLTFFSR